MTEKIPLPLYYEGKSLADMERYLLQGYLTQSGWRESAEQKLALRDGEALPWFTYGAIDFLERELTADLSIFEYGGGQSTLFWSRRVRRVAGLDHDLSFGAYVTPQLPANASFKIVEEGAPLPEALQSWAARRPVFSDPERTVRTYRSGQLNQAFEAYGLEILSHPRDTFDVVIVDGMARSLSTWSAIQHFTSRGFIVFDNSDRDFYAPAYQMLEDAGYRRLDFWGLGPINPYGWCTSVFYQPAGFPGTSWFRKPAAALPSQTGPESAQETEQETGQGLGILVLGYNRPHHLQSVLESLRQQGHLDQVHLWIDGTQSRGEFLGANEHTIKIAQRFNVAELHVQNSHLGIEKMMLDALDDMTQRYDRVMVIEDDCFPLSNAVAQFEAELAAIADRKDVYSVYGCLFGTESEDSQDFTRFQGWGWAAHSHQIRRLLPDLRALFMKSETAYLSEIQRRLTPEIEAGLDRTPGRNVLSVLKQFFSWDSATSFLCAEKDLKHQRTAERSMINTGIIDGIGHFRQDSARLRQPPFNMITLPEAWAQYDCETQPCAADRDSYGLDGLDVLLRQELPMTQGFFIEIGANDGVTQSNSVLLEAMGWRGMLIEALPAQYAKCCRSRPDMIVEHAACVGAEVSDPYLQITDVGLMSVAANSGMDAQTRESWLDRGEGFASRPRQHLEVPVSTLSKLMDKHGVAVLDLLILDVEGAEINVLEGLDFSRHAPRFILAEDAYDETISDYLAKRGYRLKKVLLERKFTRDCLYER